MSELEGMISSVLSNPDEMKKIMEMASSFMGGGKGAERESEPPAEKPHAGRAAEDAPIFTPEMTAAAMKMMKGFGGKGNDKQVLLSAMRPYLSEARGRKLEKAVQLARVLNMGISFLGKDGGLLSDILPL